MTLHPYWPLIDGTHLDYDVYDIEGQFDIGSGLFGITKQTPHANSPQRLTVKQVGSMRAMIYHTPSTPAVIKPGNTLYEARRGNVVGEVGGTSFSEMGPIPLLHDAMSEGDYIKGSLPVMWFNTASEPIEFGEYEYRRWTHHVGKPWGKWPDTIRISLTENEPPSVVISYVWARGVGLVDFWRGSIGADGKTVTNGHRYYCVS